MDQKGSFGFKESRVVGIVELNYGLDGIMYANVVEEQDDQVAAQKLFSVAIGEMTGGQKVPVLIEYAIMILPSLESREYWAKEESSPFTSAEAFVMKQLPMRLIGNFYLNFNKPPRPTRVFSDRNKAIAWLKTFLT